MTLAIGVSCPEGAVLVTDAMRVIPQPDGSVTGVLQQDARKILRAPRFAAVHSGGAPVEWPPLPELGADLETAAGQLFEFVSRLSWADGVPAAQRDENHHLIVAGGPPGQPVRMVLLRNDAPPQHGPVLVAGAPADGWWAKQDWRHSLKPTSLWDCLGVALEIAGMFISEHYAGKTLGDFAAEGLVPAVAYPLHVAWVEPFGIHISKVKDSDVAVA